MLNRIAARPALLCVVLLCALQLGCSSGGPPTEHVTGTITYQGAPVAEAQIGFVPTPGQSDVKPARGQTDAQGRYTLRTYVKPGLEVNGAMAGEFKVTVVVAGAQNRIVGYEELANEKSPVPTEFADAQTTTLSASVAPGGNNVFDFSLDAP
ncbi:MAG: hypothetical protein KDA41_12345 [Planctomycetales bacterium]|nr:hypothetical protein [Planctomycetales bacterium]